jgi:hypothetical protein
MDAPDHTPLSQDAALVLALAGTAVTFASSEQDEAERWLRVLRLHGQVGATLQALGVGEAPLANGSEPPAERVSGPRPLGESIIDVIAGRASRYAHERDAEAIGTVHVLFAVLEVYDRLFDRALYRRGTSRGELLERLTEETRPVPSDRT